jgi:hypothetical protein
MHRVRTKEYADWHKDNRKRRAIVARSHVNDIKSNTRCSDCGLMYDPVCLDFDHIKDKNKDVSILTHRYSVATILNEIDKCDVVCANCHRLRTETRRVNKVATPAVGRSRDAIRAFILSKKSKPCTDCHETFHHVVMDFDHISMTQTKVMSISRMIAYRSGIKTIEAEISKCELVCANCHRIRTFRGRTNGQA